MVKKQKFKNSLVLFSGGQDSAFLLFLILLNYSRSEVNITYVNHFAQLDTSEFFFHGLLLSNSYQCKFIMSFLTWNSETRLPSKESSFRVYRYKTGTRLSVFYKNTQIFTGHTKTDKIETFLHNLFRSVSIFSAGNLLTEKVLKTQNYHRLIVLKRKKQGKICNDKNKFHFFSNKAKKDTFLNKNSKKSKKIFLSTNQNKYIHLVRPLTDFSRFSLTNFQRNFKNPLVYDRTNKSLNFIRNRIRYHLIRYIYYFLNPRFQQNLILFLTKLENTLTFENNLNTLAIFNIIKLSSNRIFIIIDRKLFSHYPQSVQQKITKNLSQNNFSNTYISELCKNITEQGYILLLEEEIIYFSSSFIFLEQDKWVTWDSNPELIG